MQFIGDGDEIPRWNRDKLWKCNLFGGGDEIPMRKRDELWKCNSFGVDDEIPMWNRDKYGNAMKIAFTVKFHCGLETNCGDVIKSTETMKFQGETDQYSTSLNIQNPSVESRSWKRKMKVPNKYLSWQEQNGCDVIIY